MKIKDISGQRFGKLIAIQRIGKTRQGASLWKCQCDCGELATVSIGNIGRGQISCGCYRRTIGKRFHLTTHGQSRRDKHTPEYIAYYSARYRCRNSKHKNYKYYGGRGIEFRFTSFEQFFSVLGHRPEGKSLDRINNDGHYEVGNVRWATAKEQAANRRVSK